MLASVPYEPDPEVAAAHVNESAVAAVEEIAAVPGTAAFEVANEDAGAEVIRAKTMTVSPATVPDGRVNVTVWLDRVPTRKPVAAPTEIFVGTTFVAFDGTVAIRPNPNAETATSAMRLRVVFVDICFLSLVVNETFSLTAGRELISTL
jgi:hypothetical protein